MTDDRHGEPADRSGIGWLAGSWWALAVVVLAVYVLSPVRDATQHDPAFAPLTAHALVHDRDVALDGFGAARLVGHPVVLTDGSLDAGTVVERVGGPGWAELEAAVADPDVDVRDYFPWTSALLAVPAVVVADTVAAITGGADSGELLADGDLTVLHTASASMVVVGAVLAIRAAAVALLTGSRRRRRLLANASALVFALGTSAWSTASRALWQHTPSLLLSSLALWCAVRVALDDPATGAPAPAGSRRPRIDPWVVGLGAAAVGATIARPTNLAFAVVVVGWALLRRREELAPTLLSAALGAVAVVAAFVLVSWALLGRAVPEYYAAGRLRFGGWFAEAVAANWVSPSRGLLLASPVLVLAVPGTVVAWRDRGRPGVRSLSVALWVAVAAVTVSVSAFPQWWAGHSFGPRFMTEAVPLLVVLSLPAVDRVVAPERWRSGAAHPGRARAALAAVVVLALWSVAFHAVGSVAGVTGCWNRYPDDVDDDPGRVWSVADAQVLEPVHRVLDGDRRAAQDATCVGAA
ncbi:hypothetical protein [Dermatobacter hominis]|uniref:hypothetical protein n=1 Tax=Dermatobacter hominis TaxID=2884263 RepID=UPI001D0FF6E5|nr:hypothetical protein [Dermatobacter hominis]UDY37768.1 hypothetical protein LH044_09550 [Dermatobacter hominis]